MKSDSEIQKDAMDQLQWEPVLDAWFDIQQRMNAAFRRSATIDLPA